jgi:dTDP-4-amino-4,6-dideoxygalactose transaminase
MNTHTPPSTIPPAVREYFTGIFERHYYTESGPLLLDLEAEICKRAGSQHAVCVSNPTVAWIMLLEAGLESPQVLVSSNAPAALFEAMPWVRCSYQAGDVSPQADYRSTREDLSPLIGPGPGALVVKNPRGGVCDIRGLAGLARASGIPLYFDSTEAFGCEYEQRPVGSLGRAEVFSFDDNSPVGGSGGACICTDDEALADRLRSMRGSGGVIRRVRVTRTVNGRMSEAQAALALIGLEGFDQRAARGRWQHALYEQYLGGTAGLCFLSAQKVSKSNYRDIVLAIDSPIARDRIKADMAQRGYIAPAAGIMSCPDDTEYPGLNALEQTVLRLPAGEEVRACDILSICGLISSALAHAGTA